MSLPATTPETVGMSSARLARIQPAMQAWVDHGPISGVSAMIARRGQIVYHDQIGYMDKATRAPLAADAIFRIYSMTKPIICTALMTLYEEGRFQLITPVAKFIPALGQVKVLEQDGAGATTLVDPKRPITVGDLMVHTAGFTYDFLEDSPVGELYRQARLSYDADRTLAQYVETLAQLPLAYQPGSRWHYGVGIDVAAHLIEIIADRPLRDFLRERIFAPLGMVDTDFCVPEQKLPRLATMVGVGDLIAPNMTHLQMFAAWQAGVLERIDACDSYPVARPESFVRGGHGLFSTTEDYMRFALLLADNGRFGGARILGRKTLELMHANHLAPALLPYEINGMPAYGYGFGLGSRSLTDAALAGLPGTTGEYGWGGAAGTYYWIDPQEALVGVFMTQYQGMDSPGMDFRVLAYQAIED